MAYVPVLHEGYRRFLGAHARDKPFYVIGPQLYTDYRPLAKDVRCLDAGLVAQAIAAWGICSQVAVLDESLAAELAQRAPSIALPAEDVSYQVVERWFDRCAVSYETAFLRWDKSRTVQMLVPQSARHVGELKALADVIGAAEAAAARSLDWWRRVGAAIRLPNGEVSAACNVHHPHPHSAYAVGDPRSNFFKGVHLELTTATHAEAQLIAAAARRGASTEGAVMYVTDFPCPPCARLIAAAGVSRLYYRTGYAVLDGEDVLASANVEVIQIDEAPVPGAID